MTFSVVAISGPRRCLGVSRGGWGGSADECGSGVVRCDLSSHSRLLEGNAGGGVTDSVAVDQRALHALLQRRQQVIGRAQALACGMT
jgi:hypothetical protein